MNKLSPENWMYGMRWREIKHHKGVYKNCLICDIFYSNLGMKKCMCHGRLSLGHSKPENMLYFFVQKSLKFHEPI